MSLNRNDVEIVEQVKAILKKDYKYDNPHVKLANRFYISERKLRTIFKQETGKTINDFLTDVRIGKAKELLCDTDEPIKKVAYHVGYDTRNFEKQFKKLTGMTPLEWRNKNRRMAS